MEQMVNVFIMGKQYKVTASLTIMKAFEYAGYKLIRGCGCRNGFCGACATVYRIKGDRELKVCLACSTQVEEGMYLTQLPFYPLIKELYNIEEVKPTEQLMMQLYPEIYSCIGCNSCTNSCTQGLNVAVYCICTAWRICKVCRRIVRLRNVRMLFFPLPSWYFSSTGCNAGKTVEW